MTASSHAQPILLWFRQDLRLEDNLALAAALAREAPVVPLYILDDAAEGAWRAGGASRWWLHHSLHALDETLKARGSRLVLACGDAAEVLPRLVRTTAAGAVYWNDRYEPAARSRDEALAAQLEADGVEVRRLNAALLHEPAGVANKQGKPFQVFTPFWRHCLTLPVDAPWKIGRRVLPNPARWPASLDLKDLDLLPRHGWDEEFYGTWTPGEAGGRKRLAQFAAHAMNDYAAHRNLPAIDGTSVLSPHLHFGEISPRQIWAAVQHFARERGAFPPSQGASVFLSEVGWREFAYHLLYHFPHTPERPLRPEFEHFAWADDPGGANLRAWQRGRTGYPIVDAGMRQLWRTGWMHNRVRMIVASFLVKHLRLPWTAGAAWFWDTLVDADLASNTLGWQWTSGCGADAAPYFRIFAPVLQGQKFDANGDYVRRWVPELEALPAEFIHAPWLAPAEVLTRAGLVLGDAYPKPIVDHPTARDAALAAFRRLRTAPLGRP